MKRLFAAFAVIALAISLATTAAATGAQPSAPGAPRAELRGFSCLPAMDPLNRSMSVTAVMRPLTGTRHMALKFDLLMTTEGASGPKLVTYGDLGTWIAPQDPTLGQLPGDLWNLKKSIFELTAPARYRFRVAFRWTGSKGQTVGYAVRYSATCKQPELRPDLLVRSIAVTALPNQPGSDLYTAVIGNAGNSGAGPFEVLFAPADGSTPQTQMVAWIAPHSSIVEQFVGPLCAAASDPTITADSTDEVDDLNRSNNAMLAPCPAS